MAEELLTAARSALSRGDAAQAAALAEQAAEAGAGPRAWRLQAAAFIAMGRPAMAERALRRALEANPNDPDTLLELAELLASRGQIGKARELLQRAAAAAPDRPAIQQALARLSTQRPPSRIIPAIAIAAALIAALLAIAVWIYVLRPRIAARLSSAQPAAPAQSAPPAQTVAPAQRSSQPLPYAAPRQPAAQAPAHAAAPAAERQQSVAQRPQTPSAPQQALPARPPSEPSQAALSTLRPQPAQQSPLPAARQAPAQPQQPLPSVQPQPRPAQQPLVQAGQRQAPQQPLASGPPQPVPHQTPPQPMPQPEQIRVRILWVRCQFESEEEGLQEDQVVRRYRMWGELLNESNRPLRVILVRGRLLVGNQTVGYGLGEVANVPPGARAAFQFPCFQVTTAGSPMPNGYDAMALPGVDWRQVVHGMGLGVLEPLIEQAITRSGGM